MQSFREFWPYYLREHTRSETRALHIAGTTATALCLFAAIALHSWRPLLYGLVLWYALAWAGHFFIEKNKPVTFRHPLWSFYPLWSLAADWKMWALAILGRLQPEIERAGVTRVAIPPKPQRPAGNGSGDSPQRSASNSSGDSRPRMTS